MYYTQMTDYTNIVMFIFGLILFVGCIAGNILMIINGNDIPDNLWWLRAGAHILLIVGFVIGAGVLLDVYYDVLKNGWY